MIVLKEFLEKEKLTEESIELSQADGSTYRIQLDAENLDSEFIKALASA